LKGVGNKILKTSPARRQVQLPGFFQKNRGRAAKSIIKTANPDWSDRLLPKENLGTAGSLERTSSCPKRKSSPKLVGFFVFYVRRLVNAILKC
jgi:hypothetical protein